MSRPNTLPESGCAGRAAVSPWRTGGGVMRYATWLVLGLLACGEKDVEGDGTPDADADTDADTDTDIPTDTGGGNFVFIPTYVNIDAHFGVDQAGQVSSVFDPFYGYEYVPTVVVYIGSQEW